MRTLKLDNEKTKALFEQNGVALNLDMVMVKTEMGQFKIGFKEACRGASYWSDGCGGSYLITDKWDIKGSAGLSALLVNFSDLIHEQNIARCKGMGLTGETLKNLTEHAPIDFMLKYPQDSSFDMGVTNYMASMIMSLYGGKK